MMVELTNQQALTFRLLSELDAWDIDNGSVTVHFSQNRPVRGEKREVINLSTELSTPPDAVQIVQVVV